MFIALILQAESLSSWSLLSLSQTGCMWCAPMTGALYQAVWVVWWIEWDAVLCPQLKALQRHGMSLYPGAAFCADLTGLKVWPSCKPKSYSNEIAASFSEGKCASRFSAIPLNKLSCHLARSFTCVTAKPLERSRLVLIILVPNLDTKS